MKKRSRSRTGMESFLLWTMALSCVVLGFLLYATAQRYGPNRNKLAIGEDSLLDGEINLKLQVPTELDFKSKPEILALRREAIEQYPDFIQGNYRPASSVFGQIVSGLPWWGIEGQFYRGKGEQSIAGESEETRFLLNPYLLVAADPWWMWDKDNISEEFLRRSDFVFLCPPKKLIWRPDEAYAEVTYSARCASTLGYRHFDLISYNARDLNLNYIYVSYEDSLNVTKAERPTVAYAIPHYIHQGGSCGYPGGCNNMSPRSPEIEGLEIIRYPVKVVIWLWEEKPASIDQKPDMVFVISFK